jgi:hypothetical protein
VQACNNSANNTDNQCMQNQGNNSGFAPVFFSYSNKIGNKNKKEERDAD